MDRIGSLLEGAGAAGPVTAAEVYELVLALSWAIDRFGDDEPTARRRVALATAGILSQPIRNH